MDKILYYISIYPIQSVFIIGFICLAIGLTLRYLEKIINHFLTYSIFRYAFLACAFVALVVIMVYVW